METTYPILIQSPSLELPDLVNAFSVPWFNAAVDTGNGSSGSYNGVDRQFGTAYRHALDDVSEGKTKVLALAGRFN